MCSAPLGLRGALQLTVTNRDDTRTTFSSRGSDETPGLSAAEEGPEEEEESVTGVGGVRRDGAGSGGEGGGVSEGVGEGEGGGSAST